MLKLEGHIKRRLISRISNFFKKSIERFLNQKIIRLIVKIDQNAYKTAMTFYSRF